MALVVKDRVKETTATTGTGTLTLAGAVSGFQTFASALSNADTTYYAIREDSTGEWEVGLGTFTASGTLLSRDTILESSNAGSAINLTIGSAEVFITYPAEKSVYLDASGDVTSAAGQIDISNFNNDAGYSTTTGTVTSVAASAGTGISVSGSPITTSGTLTITNTAPDQTVVLTEGSNVSITGTYPNFTIASTDQFTGTVTSVAASAGTGISISGSPITTSGTLTITNTAPDQTVVLTQGSNVTITGTYPNFTIASTDTNTTYSAGDLLDLSGTTFNVDLSELTDMTATMVGTDEFVVLDASAQRRKAANEIGLSIFNNDAGFWNSSNDGSGSGLDADLLDGVQGSSYLRSDANDSFSGTITNSGVFESYYNDNLPGSNLKLGRASDQYMTFHGGSAGNYMTSISSAGNPKDAIRFGISTDSGSSLDSTYVLSGSDGTIWHSGNDGSGSGLDADTLDGVQGANYLRSDTSDTLSGDLTLTGDLTVNGNNIIMVGLSSRSKYYVWNSSTYSIGMDSGYTFGALGDYAMTFQMNDDADRGFWWGDSTHTNAQGAMSLTTDGRATIATSLSVGGGESRTTAPASTLEVVGDAVVTGDIYVEDSAVIFNNDAGAVAKINNSGGDLYFHSDANFKFYETDSNVVRATIDVNNGRMRIGDATAPTSTLEVSGVGFAESFQEDYDALSGTTPAPDADNAGAFSLTTSGNTTFTFGSVTSGRSAGFILELTAGGTHTITWPASVDWAGGTAPDAPASGETDIYVFWTRDGGTTWYGIQSVDAAA